MVSTYGQQLWDWLDDSLQRFKEDCRSSPDRDWTEHGAQLWGRLGVAAGGADPVIDELIRLVDELVRERHEGMADADRAGYLAGDALDRDVRERIELVVTRYAAQPDRPTEAEPKEPSAVADEIVRELALPVLRELARTRPELLARHSTDELVARLGQVIAGRLAQH